MRKPKLPDHRAERSKPKSAGAHAKPRRTRKRKKNDEDNLSEAKSSSLLLAKKDSLVAPEPLRRKSLISQATDTLRENISNGVWRENLPGERQLCEILMISRPTLRSALNQLEKENIISVAQGKHRLIKSSPTGAKVPRRSSTEVILLIPEIPSPTRPVALYLIDETYKTLQKAGYRLSIQSPSWINYKNPELYLARHVQENPAACWALLSVSESVQRWFSDQAVPALVSGSCYPGVQLPSIDLDNRAITRHAVGTFLRKGYTRIFLLVPEKLRPGTTTTLAAFNEAIKASTHPETEGRVIRVSPRREGLIRQLNEQLRPGCRVGLYVTNPLDALFLLTYLPHTNLKLRTDVGMICQGNEYFFEHMMVKPTCYLVSKERFTAKFCQLLLQLARNQNIPAKAVLQMPNFQAGETL